MFTIVQRDGHKRLFSGSDSSSEDEMESEFTEDLKWVRRTDGRRRVPLKLVEVFSVCILNLPVKGSHLYGTITITEGIRGSFLYNRKREESEFIRPWDPVLLTGPPYSITALDNFCIDVDLRDRDRDDDDDDDIPPDHVVCRDPLESIYEVMEWNSYDEDVFDKPLYRKIESKNFTVGVTFIVLEDAVQATVNVTLIMQDPKTPNVSGSIIAGNCNFSQESVLFQKASHEHIHVRSGELIPLSRSVVSVPLNSVLIVRANLWDYGADSSGVIAKGIAKFPINLSRKFFEERILGQDSEIRVKVTLTGDRYLSNGARILGRGIRKGFANGRHTLWIILSGKTSPSRTTTG